MQKFNYKLKTFIKAIEVIAGQKGLYLKMSTKKGSGIRFELFKQNASVPENFWVIHTEHEAAKRITSRQDYKKAAYVLNVELEYFVEILEQEK
jgi:hypothetical protein